MFSREVFVARVIVWIPIATNRPFIRRQDFRKNADVKENIILNRIGPNYISMYSIHDEILLPQAECVYSQYNNLSYTSTKHARPSSSHRKEKYSPFLHQ